MKYSQFKPSYYEAFTNLINHVTVYTSTLFATWYFKESYVSFLTIPMLGLMSMRSFIIFHDCGHNSYFPDKKLNYLLGSILGLFVFTPYCWSYSHSNHHLTSGDKENKLDHPQNETVTITLKQYKRFSPLRKCVFTVLRYPLFYFLVSPLIKFMIIYRCEVLLEKINNYTYKQSLYLILFDTLINNLGICVLLFNLYNNDILPHFLSGLSVSYSLSFMLFHNQHTFNTPYVVTHKEWNKKQSGTDGSSFIRVPWYLKYFTLGIEYHHIHHMNASVPGYKIQQFHEELSKTNDLDDINCLTMEKCYRNLWLVLYDECNNKYITLDECNNKYITLDECNNK